MPKAVTLSRVSTYNALATAGTGLPAVRGAPTAITIGSGTSIGSTSVCASAICTAGLYNVSVYIEITTACTTTGTYAVNLIYTDDQGAMSSGIAFPVPILRAHGRPS